MSVGIVAFEHLFTVGGFLDIQVDYCFIRVLVDT